MHELSYETRDGIVTVEYESAWLTRHCYYTVVRLDTFDNEGVCVGQCAARWVSQVTPMTNSLSLSRPASASFLSSIKDHIAIVS